MELETIHNAQAKGNLSEMVRLIDLYGVGNDFFHAFLYYLKGIYEQPTSNLYFEHVVIEYHRFKAREEVTP